MTTNLTLEKLNRIDLSSKSLMMRWFIRKRRKRQNQIYRTLMELWSGVRHGVRPLRIASSARAINQHASQAREDGHESHQRIRNGKGKQIETLITTHTMRNEHCSSLLDVELEIDGAKVDTVGIIVLRMVYNSDGSPCTTTCIAVPEDRTSMSLPAIPDIYCWIIGSFLAEYMSNCPTHHMSNCPKWSHPGTQYRQETR